jgi:threonine dehydrogenase-like Zn-dependent dehydrogenase
MLAVTLHAPGEIQVENIPDPILDSPTDAVVQVVCSAVCGTDLGSFSGVDPVVPGQRMGHEFLGVVHDVGSAVAGVKLGDLVVAPLSWSDGNCEFCRKGLQTACVVGGEWGGRNQGGQAEAVRVPHADGTLLRLPGSVDSELFPALLTLSDVMAAGHHAVLSANVQPGDTVAVVGDGAMGLCAILAARRRRAGRVIMLGAHRPRLDVALRFGATDLITAREDAAIAEVLDLTGGSGADAVIDTFGSRQSLMTAIGVARAGACVGYVGVTHQATWIDIHKMVRRNISLCGGLPPARAYMPELLPEILSGHLDPSPVFDLTVPLSDAARGYTEMAARSAIKALLRP